MQSTLSGLVSWSNLVGLVSFNLVFSDLFNLTQAWILSFVQNPARVRFAVSLCGCLCVVLVIIFDDNFAD